MSTAAPSHSKAATPLALDAVAEFAATAGTYADVAVRFAEIGDAKGVAYALRCLSAAALAANEAALQLSPSRAGDRA